MPKHRRKRRPPQRTLALPNLEQTKSAILNSLTSKSGQRTYDHAINEFVDWYCLEPRLASIVRLFFDTESTWNSAALLRQPSTCDWLQSGVWHTRQLIPACSVQDSPPAFAESKAYAESACDWAIRPIHIR